MQNILLINGKKAFHHSYGKLNTTLSEVARETLIQLGKTIKETIIDDGYIIEDEIKKYLWADAVVYQMPGWWMSVPWIVKKYIDEVFTVGHGRLYASDGRSRDDIHKKYGSGGLLHNKKYMISITWNAPFSAFTDKDQFFEGIGVDGLYLHFHKANQFLGMAPLPTFICNDVIKNPVVNDYVANYKAHLMKTFS